MTACRNLSRPVAERWRVWLKQLFGSAQIYFSLCVCASNEQQNSIASCQATGESGMAIQSAIPSRSLLDKQENGPRIRLRLPAILGIYGKSSEKGNYCIPLRNCLVSCCEGLQCLQPSSEALPFLANFERFYSRHFTEQSVNICFCLMEIS